MPFLSLFSQKNHKKLDIFSRFVHNFQKQTRFVHRVQTHLKLFKNPDGIWIQSRFRTKIAFGSMFTRVYAIFGANFQAKKASRSSRLVSRGTNPRHHWVQNRHSRNIPSRLKGIETKPCNSISKAVLNSQHTFPFEGN